MKTFLYRVTSLRNAQTDGVIVTSGAHYHNNQLLLIIEARNIEDAARALNVRIIDSFDRSSVGCPTIYYTSSYYGDTPLPHPHREGYFFLSLKEIEKGDDKFYPTFEYCMKHKITAPTLLSNGYVNMAIDTLTALEIFMNPYALEITINESGDQLELTITHVRETSRRTILNIVINSSALSDKRDGVPKIAEGVLTSIHTTATKYLGNHDNGLVDHLSPCIHKNSDTLSPELITQFTNELRKKLTVHVRIF